MQKKFLTNLSLLIGANLLIKPFWILGVDRAVQNSVGNEQYGIYSNLFAFSLLFSMLLDFGINNYASSSIAKHPQLLSKQFSSLSTLKLLFSGAYILVTLVAGVIYGFNAHFLWLLVLMSVNQALAFFILFIRSHVSGMQLFKTDALLSVMDRMFMILFCGLMLWFSFFHVSISHFVYAQTAGYLVSLLVCFLVLKPHLEFYKPGFSSVQMITLIRQTWPYALLALVMTLYTRIDVILIKKMLPDGDMENGVYAQANRLLEAANMLAAMISSMLLPLFARMLQEKEDVTPVVRISMSILFLPACMLAIFCHEYRYELMDLLYDGDTSYPADVFGTVIFSFCGYASIYIFGTLLTSMGSLKVLTITAAIALVLNGVLNLFVIPRFGAYGAACVAVATNLFAGALNFVYAKRRARLNLNARNLVKFFAFVASYIIVILLLRQAEAGMLVGIVVSGLCWPAFLLAFRIEKHASITDSIARLIKR